ncbi:amino acid ABC transporter permease [Chengkuizengella axinellae]|uniref:ABC transporter permease subunit n=1 Tax=Chengkuizengella axinellae TaxID=3064388 RepID=A0ABT9J4E5_9BACL|nr:ABC transporter permease subunit [Chengkuizengella sp. 2205SS18-9]MDP5276484.1 ABC transporter permease subunit [Chengkuizengella sp. 2205SS18-9]
MKNEKSTATPFWRDTRVIPILLQILFVVIVVIVGTFLFTNAMTGLDRLGIKFGFDFLSNTAFFDIGEKEIEYTPKDSYFRAYLVGIVNTIKVGIAGIILASIVGVLVGISRLSNNWLVRKVSTIYVEIFRNTPLLVQIFIWYLAVILQFPKIEEEMNLGPFFISNRGTALPWFDATSGSLLWIIFSIVGLIAAVVIRSRLINKQIETGKITHPGLWSIAVFIGTLLLALLITRSAPFTLDYPSINGRLYEGGYTLTTGFQAMLLALVVYTSTYIAEIVRGGIQAVSKGQVEASKALGLKNSTTMSKVIFPQAIRIIIPPVTSQYLNLIKNSSLAMAVGFPELVYVSQTVLNQTGRAIENITLVILVYLTLSVITSIIMNIFNKKFQLVER